MPAELLKGKPIADKIKEELKNEIDSLKSKTGAVPKLVAVQIGENSASEVYLKAQKNNAEKLGIQYVLNTISKDVSQQEVEDLIKRLNDDSSVSAIILQLPVPQQIDAKKIVNLIESIKDAEGMHPSNLGQVLLGKWSLAPCTASACLALIESTGINLYGKEVVIVGHSEIVGKPLSLMLLSKFATTTVCHIGTGERGVLPEHVKRAEVLVVAVGKAGLIKGDWIKEGAIVVDVGINKVGDNIVGDVEFEGASNRAAYITPVPGGVGPLTTTMLMKNTVEAFKANKGKTKWHFAKKIKQGKFLVTSEIGPPKGTDIHEALEDAVLIKDKVDAINVTDLQSSVMRVGSLAICRLLKEKGIEPILQVTCRDRNRLALQSDLLSASVLGIENVLLLTGDHPTLGDHPDAKPVFDLDSVQLIQVAKTLESGKDMKGNDLLGSPKFCIGAVVNPGADPLEPEIIKMEKKIQAGAQFFQTQAVYDIDQYKKFLDVTKHLKTTILAGIVLLKSAGMANYMNKNVSGVHVPDNLIEEIKSVSKEDRKKKSIEIAARLIKELKPLCPGIHLMPLGWDKLVPQILESAGL